MLKKIIFTLGFTVATGILVSGCATNSAAKQAQISIERVDSSSVNITHAYLTKTEKGLNLRGELKRKQHSHGQVLGHVHVEVVNANGDIIKTVELDPSRKASSDHIAKFHTTLPNDATGNTVKIIHHDALSHKQESKVNVWQDANN